MSILRFLRRLFLRPPEEHVVNCPWCGKIVVVDCEE